MRTGFIAIFTFTGILLDILIILFLIAGDRMEVTRMSIFFATITSAMLTFKLMEGVR